MSLLLQIAPTLASTTYWDLLSVATAKYLPSYTNANVQPEASEPEDTTEPFTPTEPIALVQPSDQLTAKEEADLGNAVIGMVLRDSETPADAALAEKALRDLSQEGGIVLVPNLLQPDNKSTWKDRLAGGAGMIAGVATSVSITPFCAAMAYLPIPGVLIEYTCKVAVLAVMGTVQGGLYEITGVDSTLTFSDKTQKIDTGDFTNAEGDVNYRNQAKVLSSAEQHTEEMKAADLTLSKAAGSAVVHFMLHPMQRKVEFFVDYMMIWGRVEWNAAERLWRKNRFDAAIDFNMWLKDLPVECFRALEQLGKALGQIDLSSDLLTCVWSFMAAVKDVLWLLGKLFKNQWFFRIVLTTVDVILFNKWDSICQWFKIGSVDARVTDLQQRDNERTRREDLEEQVKNNERRFRRAGGGDMQMYLEEEEDEEPQLLLKGEEPQLRLESGDTQLVVPRKDMRMALRETLDSGLQDLLEDTSLMQQEIKQIQAGLVRGMKPLDKPRARIMVAMDSLAVFRWVKWHMGPAVSICNLSRFVLVGAYRGGTALHQRLQSPYPLDTTTLAVLSGFNPLSMVSPCVRTLQHAYQNRHTVGEFAAENPAYIKELEDELSVHPEDDMSTQPEEEEESGVNMSLLYVLLAAAYI